MKISASILAADQNNIINNLNDKKGLFDYVHIDIGDNVFCPTYGISKNNVYKLVNDCLLYTSPSPRDRQKSRMPSSA